MPIKLILFILMLGIFTVFAGNPVSVPLANPVYEFIDRMETLGLIHDALDGAKPMTRGRIAEILNDVAENSAELTAIDRRKLDDFLLDFRFELNHTEKYYRSARLSNRKIPEGQNWYSLLSSWGNFKTDFNKFFEQNFPEEENHVFTWEKDSSNFYLDYIHNVTYEKRSDGVNRLANWQTYRFQSVLDNDFAMALEISLFGFHGNQEYILQHPILKSSYIQRSEDQPAYSDRSGGELAWNTKYIEIHFAQQEVAWGLGESGKLVLSDNVEHYPYLSLSKNWGWGKFTFLHGKLLSVASGDSVLGAPVRPDKWVAAQRLEFSPWNPLTIGLNETFIYGNRYADWAYLIPFNFYRAVQHKLQDRDNATISVDFELTATPGAKFYGTIFLDEFKRSELFTNWYGNKHGFHFGISLQDPLRLDNTSLVFEYVAIMPWVYTHKFIVNSYSSEGRSLGYWTGPNSEVFYLHLKKDWHKRLQTGIKLRQYKHGANYPNENIGGDILSGHETLLGSQTDARETRKFLEGILTTEKLADIYCTYEAFNDFYLYSGFRFIEITGENTKSNPNEFYFGFKLDY